MNTIEGNKLIAVFMRYEVDKQKWAKSQNILIYEDAFHIDKQIILSSDLIFHSSWNWMMPVVEKISKIKCLWDNEQAGETDTYYPRTFGMLNTETKRPMVRLNSNCVFEADTLIEATWLAVVDFIQWYNNQTK